MYLTWQACCVVVLSVQHRRADHHEEKFRSHVTGQYFEQIRWYGHAGENHHVCRIDGQGLSRYDAPNRKDQCGIA